MTAARELCVLATDDDTLGDYLFILRADAARADYDQSGGVALDDLLQDLGL
ncbi:MAG: hypothetical protein Q8K89_07770 [Actinomycetota bacterium]|nr:hypothetical protein [Actinomycetota bacterium]